MIKIISMYFIPFQAWLSKNIHQPAGNWLAGYRQLEKALKEGKARSIGISNFEGKYIGELETKWETAPQFIQVEAHPYFTQKDLRVTLDKYSIKLMSWYRRKPMACLPSFRYA